MRRALGIGIFLFVILLTAALGIPTVHDPLLEKALEAWLNATQEVFFDGSIDLRGLRLERQLKISIRELTGSWQMPGSSLPIEVRDIRLEDPATHFMLGKPVRIQFERFRPRGSQSPGIRGAATLQNDRAGTFKLNAQFLGLDLADLIPLDPENLKGASGTLIGNFDLESNNLGDGAFTLDLKVAEPGGRLQARFFDLLLPYLPAAEQAALAVIRGTQMVNYREADLHVRRAGGETINLLLHLLVPDYNLNLNLNLTLRVEEKEAYSRLAGLAGLVRVEKR
jgi:hypothetical protein